MSDIPRRYGTADTCSPEEFEAFVTDTRVACEAGLAQVAAIDPETLTPDERAEYDAQKAGYEQVLAMLEDDALELHAEATEYADRELTPAEVQALGKKQ